MPTLDILLPEILELRKVYGTISPGTEPSRKSNGTFVKIAAIK